jgi:hypothetical protein
LIPFYSSRKCSRSLKIYKNSDRCFKPQEQSYHDRYRRLATFFLSAIILLLAASELITMKPSLFAAKTATDYNYALHSFMLLYREEEDSTQIAIWWLLHLLINAGHS